MWGSISGGCLEGEVAQQAAEALEEGTPRLLPFELDEDDLLLGFGTGCDGVVHVLIEPVLEGGKDGVLDWIGRCISERRRAVVATVIEASEGLDEHVGRHLIIDEDRTEFGTLADSSLRHEVLGAVKGLLDADRPEEDWDYRHIRATDKRGGGAEVLFEIVRPPIRLLILGEGHDVKPVVEVAGLLGWEAVVVGRKPVEVLADRFPEAHDHVFLMHPQDVTSEIRPDERTAAIVMNHTYLRDRELMSALLESSIPYVGMLGPKERTDRMIDEVSRTDSPLTDSRLARLFGPVGLDIGTETPEEIALSAAAEIQAVLNERYGGFLRDRPEPIHGTRTEIRAVGNASD